MKIRMASWDWKEYPDLGELLNTGLRDVFDGKKVPCVTEVKETHSDENVVIISSDVIDIQQAQTIFDRYGRDYPEENNPYEAVLIVNLPRRRRI